jgi:LPXTG-motif cell wall-anchored protein
VTTTAVRGVTSTTATSPSTTTPASTTTTAPTTTTTTPGTLAYTGSDSSKMLGFGLALILLGGGVVAFSYRRRPLV